MNTSQTVLYILHYLLIIPLMTFCYLPLKNKFKFSEKKFFCGLVLTSVVLTLAFILLSFFISPIHPAFFYSLAYVIAFVVFYICSGIEWYKVLSLFLDNCALLCSAAHFDRCIDVAFNPYGGVEDLSTVGVLFQWIFLIIILVAFIKFANSKFTWLLMEFNHHDLWACFSAVTLLISFANLLMIPLKNSNMFVGRIYSASVISSILLFLLFIIVNVVFYLIAHGLYEREKTELRNNFLQIQASQYQRLKLYMEETSQLRHDFRHSVRAIKQMASSGDMISVINYLNDYDKKLTLDKPQIFCDNIAVNALLNYYIDFAKRLNIDFTIKTVIPKNAGVSDVDICSVIGNLVENAIHACTHVDKGNRFIKLTVKTDGSNNIYILCANSFIEIKNIDFNSDKNIFESHGIGLRSIKAIAEKYNGFSKVFTSGEHTFCVDVLLKSK